MGEMHRKAVMTVVQGSRERILSRHMKHYWRVLKELPQRIDPEGYEREQRPNGEYDRCGKKTKNTDDR